MLPRTRLSYPNEIRFENLFGNLGRPELNAPLPPDKELRFQSLFGDFRPGEPAWQLSYPDELRFHNLFDGCFESDAPPVTGEPVAVFDFLGEDLRALYEKCKNSPGSIFAMASPSPEATDISHPAETWTVQRDKKRRALAIPKSLASPLQELADMVRLDADKALGPSGWLRDAGGSPVASFTPGAAYTVPNTLVLSVGDTSSLVIGANNSEVNAAKMGIGESFSGSSPDAARKAEAFGLGTNYFVENVGPVATLNGVNNALASPDVAIWAHIGHGEPYPDKGPTEVALVLADKTPHPGADFKSFNRLALIIIYACHGGKFSADKLLSEKGIILGTNYSMGARDIKLDSWWNTQIKWQNWDELPRKKRKKGTEK